MVRRSTLQPSSLPAMENLFVQRIAETLHGVGPYTGLLPCCTRLRLGLTPEKRDPVPTPNSWWNTSPCNHPLTPRDYSAHLLHAAGYGVRTRIVEIGKKTFEKFDGAEITLHAAIIESLSQGTIRTINTQHAAGISSLTALQLVEVVHIL
jgi:hypothetical protein